MGKFIIGRDNVEYLKKLERKKYEKIMETYGVIKPYSNICIITSQ